MSALLEAVRAEIVDAERELEIAEEAAAGVRERVEKLREIENLANALGLEPGGLERRKREDQRPSPPPARPKRSRESSRPGADDLADRLLALLDSKGELRPREVAAALGVSPERLRRLIASLEGKVERIGGERGPGVRYRLRARGDWEKPSSPPTGAVGARHAVTEMEKRIVAAVKAGPLTSAAIARVTGYHEDAVSRICAKLAQRRVLVKKPCAAGFTYEAVGRPGL